MEHEPIFNLTPEEQEMENAAERGEYISKPITEKAKKRLQQIARNTIAKNKSITVRISERDLLRLKATAMREGLSYQTYLTSLIHKNVR